VKFLKESAFDPHLNYMKLIVLALAFCFPISALADLAESVVLQTNSGVTLETGAVGGAGVDIVWSGTRLTRQNGAEDVSLGVAGIQSLENYTQATLAADTGQFTVPSYHLSAQPVATPGASGSNGAAILQNNIQRCPARGSTSARWTPPFLIQWTPPSNNPGGKLCER